MQLKRIHIVNLQNNASFGSILIQTEKILLHVTKNLLVKPVTTLSISHTLSQAAYPFSHLELFSPCLRFRKVMLRPPSISHHGVPANLPLLYLFPIKTTRPPPPKLGNTVFPKIIHCMPSSCSAWQSWRLSSHKLQLWDGLKNLCLPFNRLILMLTALCLMTVIDIKMCLHLTIKLTNQADHYCRGFQM